MQRTFCWLLRQGVETVSSISCLIRTGACAVAKAVMVVVVVVPYATHTELRFVWRTTRRTSAVKGAASWSLLLLRLLLFMQPCCYYCCRGPACCVPPAAR